MPKRSQILLKPVGIIKKTYNVSYKYQPKVGMAFKTKIWHVDFPNLIRHQKNKPFVKMVKCLNCKQNRYG